MNTGQIVKTKNVPFAMVPTEFLKDPSVSMKAKGLLSFLLSLPSDWVIYKTKLSEYFLDGKDSISSAWNELETLGFIQSVRIVGEDGLSRGFNYIVYYERVSSECGFPAIGKSEIGKPAPTYIDNTKKEITNKYTFEDFWNSYNKKNGKKKAQDVWNKMREEDRIKAVELMDNHKSGREARYWKDPERYLRDKRWEDEPIKQITKTNTTNYDSNNAW